MAASDTLEKFLRTTKKYYEEVYNTLSGGQKGIDQFLFPIDDYDTSANFALDKLVINPHGITFRRPGEGSPVRPYNPGTGNIYEIPIAGDKTPITQRMRDAVVAGIESTGGFASSHERQLTDILRTAVAAHNVTRWKLAIDTMRTGAFSPVGLGGNDIGLSIDFSQSADCDITYDFTATGATIDIALREALSAYTAQYGTKNNVVILMGEDWLAEFESDDDVLEKMKANMDNVLVQQNLVVQSLQNTYGLHLVGRYRPSGSVVTAWICNFSPDTDFTQYSGATATDFFPSDEMLIFSMNSPRYRVFRGVDAFDGGGNIVRSVGEIVFDSYTENDPPTEQLRNQTRFACIPANIDHVVRSTGTFTSAS